MVQFEHSESKDRNSATGYQTLPALLFPLMGMSQATAFHSPLCSTTSQQPAKVTHTDKEQKSRGRNDRVEGGNLSWRVVGDVTMSNCTLITSAW